MNEEGFNSNESPEVYTEGYKSAVDTEPEPEANRFLGMLGAVIGSLLGVALWLLIDKLGYIAAISGLVMLMASFKGYKILGKSLDRFGSIFCTVLSFVMIFVSVNLAVVFVFVEEFGFEMVKSAGLYSILEYSWTEPELVKYILIDLAIGYGLYLLAGFSYIKKAVKGEKV